MGIEREGQSPRLGNDQDSFRRMRQATSPGGGSMRKKQGDIMWEGVRSGKFPSSSPRGQTGGFWAVRNKSCVLKTSHKDRVSAMGEHTGLSDFGEKGGQII